MFGGVDKHLVKNKWKLNIYKNAMSNLLVVLSSDSSCQLQIFWHDGHSLPVDCAQVWVFKQWDHVCLRCFLQCCDCGCLETQIILKFGCDLSYQSLEWQFSQQQFGWFLVSSDLSQCNSSWSETVWLLNSTRCWSRFACCFGCQLLSWCFTTSRFSCGLLGSSHCNLIYLICFLSWLE